MIVTTISITNRVNIIENKIQYNTLIIRFKSFIDTTILNIFFLIKQMTNTYVRTPDNGYIDTEGLFEFQQHNGDNSDKAKNIPLYNYNQIGKLEAGNTQLGASDVDTIEDQTRYKTGINDAVTFNNIIGGNAGTTRILPGANRNQFSIGDKSILKNNYVNNLSKYSNDNNNNNKTKTKEKFGIDKPVEWSTMPTANVYQNGTAMEQLGTPDFVIDRNNSDNAYDNLSMSKWKASMDQTLNNYDNTLAKAVTFGGYDPDNKEGYCSPNTTQSTESGSLFSQIAIVIISVLIVIIMFVIIQQVCTSQKKHKSKSYYYDY